MMTAHRCSKGVNTNQREELFRVIGGDMARSNGIKFSKRKI